jgi:hypothetical protein
MIFKTYNIYTFELFFDVNKESMTTETWKIYKNDIFSFFQTLKNILKFVPVWLFENNKLNTYQNNFKMKPKSK